jgi:hypothetical protein
MTHTVISLTRIEREAKAAAKLPGDINHHCPYPFDSDAGHAFKGFFNSARATHSGHLSAEQTTLSTETTPA